MQLPLGIYIREKSLLAKLAAARLKAGSVAIVFGNTIHLHGVSSEAFLKQPQWVKHELKHVEQYRRYGFFRFIFLYLWQSARYGYHQNRFEAEAREAEENH